MRAIITIGFLLFAWQAAAEDLSSAVEGIAREAQGRVGASAVILETGKTIAGYHAREQFPMQSVYKLPIAMAAMRAVRLDKVRMSDIITVRVSDYVRAGQHSPLRDENPKGAEVSFEELVRLAVEESDGSASDVVLRRIGGPKFVMDYLHRTGVVDMTVRDTEKRMGADWSVQYANSSSPDAAIAVLRAASTNRLLMKWMTETKTFPTRIKGLLPEGTVVAHKTGSSGARDGMAAATNDIGIVRLPNGRRLAIAVFVADSKADDATRDAVIARIAKAAWDEATKLP